MKAILTICCFALLVVQSQLFAQTTATKVYVDRNLFPVEQKEKASYFRVAAVDKDNMLNGPAEYFYLNNEDYARNLYAKGNYENNVRTGKWEWWYANGLPAEIGYFEKKTSPDKQQNVIKLKAEEYTYKIESYWDSTGVQQVTNGNGKVQYVENGITTGKGSYQNGVKHGEWEGTYQIPDTDESIPFTEQYTAGELISGVSYDKAGKPYSYKVLEILPEPKGGMNGLMRYLMQSLRYPTQARRKGIEGKVMVQFYVNKDGSLSGIELMQGIGGGCDEEALRVVKGFPKWTPAVHRGQEVRVRMSLPIVFKLG